MGLSRLGLGLRLLGLSVLFGLARTLEWLHA